MQNRILEKDIHDIVRRKLAKGPSNLSDANLLLFELSTFGRLIADYMFEKVKNDFSLDITTHQMELHLLDHACHALMGEVYQTGSCGQYASIALLEYLKRGVTKPVEYIQFFGLPYDSDDEINHAVVTTGRNADFSNDVSKWGKFYVIDAWSNDSFSYPGSSSVDKITSLGYPRQFYDFFRSINGLYFNCRFDKNITNQQWEQLAEFFKYLSNFNEDNFNSFLRIRSSNKVNSAKELSLIHKKIQAYIAEFNQLAAHPHVDQINIMQSKPKPRLQKAKVQTHNTSEIANSEANSLTRIYTVKYTLGLFQSVSEKHELPNGLSKSMMKEGTEALGKGLVQKELLALKI